MEVKIIGLLLLTIVIYRVTNTSQDFQQAYFGKLNVWMDGCTILKFSTSLLTDIWCSTKCVENNCSAFRLSTQSCTLCLGEGVKDLLFDGKETYSSRVLRVLNVPLRDEHTTTPYTLDLIDFQAGGKVFFFSETFLSFGMFEVNFTNRIGETIYRFSPLLNMVDNQTALRVRGTDFQPIDDPFPFEVGKKVEVYVLATPYEFKIYYDNVYCCTFDTRGSSDRIEQLTIAGNIRIEDLII